jgi:hypothetical protein
LAWNALFISIDVSRLGGNPTTIRGGRGWSENSQVPRDYLLVQVESSRVTQDKW